MATLAESFLADLEDLSDDEPVAAEAGEGDDMEDDGGEDNVRRARGRCCCARAPGAARAARTARTRSKLLPAAPPHSSDTVLWSWHAVLCCLPCSSLLRLAAMSACLPLRLELSACRPLSCKPAPQLDDIESLNYDDLSAVAKLASSAQYADVMQVRKHAGSPKARRSLQSPAMPDERARTKGMKRWKPPSGSGSTELTPAAAPGPLPFVRSA